MPIRRFLSHKHRSRKGSDVKLPDSDLLCSIARRESPKDPGRIAPKETFSDTNLSSLASPRPSTSSKASSTADDEQSPRAAAAMASPISKDKPPLTTGIHIDTTIATMEKAALSTTIASCPSPFDRSPCPSGHTSPRSERSANPFDTDVEAMMTNGSADKCPRTSIVLTRRNDCQVWPGKDHWKQRAKAAKRQPSCACLVHLDRRTRIAVKILIVVLVVGVAVGIGFGVSKPLGAPIWGKTNS